MSFLVPAAFGLAALAGPLIVLYMLRSKRRPQSVASTMLWQKVGEPVSAAVPWKPLKLTTLLVLQLLILGLFVLSLARPFVSEATVLGPHTVFVMDTSGSMAMADRLDQAKRTAADLATDISDANLGSVVEAGANPRVLVAFSGDAAAVVEAIESLRPGGGVEDLSTAVRLARGLAAPDRETSVVIFSDGGAAPLPDEPVVGADHLSFTDFDSNLSISGLDADPSSDGAPRLFVQVDNHGPNERTISIELEVDGLPAGSVDMTVAGNDSNRQVIPVDAAPGSLVTARLDHGGDALALDDEADLVIGGGDTRSVGVLGEGSPFLTALLRSTPGVAVAEDAADSDVLIVDGGELPEIDRPTWLIRPESTPEGLELTGLARNLGVTFARPGDPVLDGVDLSGVAVAEAQTVEGLTWLPLFSSGDTPLTLMGEVNGYRVAYTTFDLVHSNLPVEVAFPILGANLLEWLGGGESGSVSSEVAGTPIPLVTPGGSRATVTLPDGSTRELAGDAGVFLDTDDPGVYLVEYVDAEDVVSPGEIAIRRFSVAESAGPSRSIAVTSGPGGDGDDAFLLREGAPWVIAAALGLMAIEWWVGHQRPGWGRRRQVAT